PGELPRLLAFSRTISNGDRLIIHGNASEEGDAQFNENLSCYRAHKAQDLLAPEFSLRNVSVNFLLIKHGAIPGGRRRNRSVVIDWIPANPPRSEQQPPQPGDRPPPDVSCARNSGCPAEFCLPFPTRAEALSHRAANRDGIITNVGRIVLDGGATEVRNLFAEFLDGGQPHRDLSSRLAPFFTRSSAT